MCQERVYWVYIEQQYRVQQHTMHAADTRGLMRCAIVSPDRSGIALVCDPTIWSIDNSTLCGDTDPTAEIESRLYTCVVFELNAQNWIMDLVCVQFDLSSAVRIRSANIKGKTAWCAGRIVYYCQKCCWKKTKCVCVCFFLYFPSSYMARESLSKSFPMPTFILAGIAKMLHSTSLFILCDARSCTGGVVYSLLLYIVSVTNGYIPDYENWLCHFFLPLCYYASLFPRAHYSRYIYIIIIMGKRGNPLQPFAESSRIYKININVQLRINSLFSKPTHQTLRVIFVVLRPPSSKYNIYQSNRQMFTQMAILSLQE